MAILAFLMVVGAGSALQAASFTVNTLTDTHQASSGTNAADSNGNISLRSAIEAANNTAGSSTITFSVTGTINLSLGQLNVAVAATGNNITITGPGAPASLVINQTTANRIISTGSGAVTLLIQNVTLKNGANTTGSGAAINSGGSGSATTAINCIFQNNSVNTTTGGNGGAISDSSNATSHNLTLTNCQFLNNLDTAGAGGGGGAVNYSGNGTLSVTGCTFSGNQAALSGGAIAASGATGGTYNITGNTFLNNAVTATTSAGGGAIAVVNGTATVSYNRFKGNTCNVAANGNTVYESISAGTTTANLNWWASNTGPMTNDVYNTTVSTYLKLNVTASPSPILVSGTSTITASFTKDSTGATVSTANLGALIGLTDAFGGNALTGSSFSGAQTTIQSTGQATATYNAGSTGGVETLTNTVDGVAASVQLTVNQPPSITSGNSTTFKVGTAGTFSVTASGYPAPTFSTASTLPSGVTLSSAGVLSGTPAAGSGGVYTLSITASNGVSPNATQSFTLTVNEAPTITSANNTTFKVGTAGSFSVTASGYPAPTFSTASTLPSGVTLSSAGVLSGTPAAGSGGTYSITLTASNGVTPNGSQSFTLTVSEAPSITSASSTTFKVGTVGSFTVTTGSHYPASETLSKTGSLPSGVTFTDNGNGTATLAGTPVAGTGGSYPITISAANGVTPNASQSFTLTVNEAPSITSASSTSFTVGTAGTFTVTTGSHYPAAETLSKTGSLPSGVTFTDNGNGTATIAGTPAASTGGSYPITITASNGISPDASQSFTLTVNQAPVITSAASTTFKVGTAGTFSVTASGYPAPTFSTVSTLPSGVTLSTAGVLSGTPAPGTGGSYPISIKAANGNSPDATQSFTLTVNDAPAITSVNNATFKVGTAGTFSVTATGYPTPTFSTASTLPSGVTLSTGGVLSGTPAAGTGGVYSISITASNGVSPNATQSFTLTVNQAPAITSASNTTFQVGTADSFSVTASGYPAPTFSTVSTLPSGVTLSTGGVLSGTPAPGTGGSYPITITATNGISPDASQSFTLTVNEGPVITSVNHTTFQVGTAGTFTVTASGTPASTFTETGALPSGVMLSTGGVLSGTPAAGTGGVYSITITASNGHLPDGTQSFTLTVNEAPAITSANNVTFQVGTVGTFTVTASGMPASTFSETGTLPSGVTLSSGGVLSGTPAPGTGGVYPISIKAANGILPDATQSFTLTVNSAPAITSASSTTLKVGTAGSFTVTTGSAYPTAETLSHTGSLPSGVAFTDNGDGTATLAGTPAAGTGGAYSITISASNGVSPDASQNFTLTVDEAPSITSANHVTFDAGTFSSFTVTTGSCYPAITSIGETGSLPSGLTFTDNGDGTATLSGNASTAAGGDFPITITASNGISPDATQSFTLTVNVPAAKFSVSSVPSTIAAGTSFNVTVTALDASNGLVANYAGTVHLTSSDASAVLPSDATLTNGTGTFSVTLKTAGSQTITATDTVQSSVTGTSTSVSVTALAATHYGLSIPSSTTAGVAASLTVTALDAYGNTDPNYAGTVHFTSTDGSATLPADSTLTNGVGTFNVTFTTAGSQTVTTTDTVTSSISATTSSVTVSAAAATHLTVSAPATATVNSAFNLSVQALDAFGNLSTGYSGTVHFTSTDSSAVLPADSTLTNGAGTFSATLESISTTYTISATDTVDSSVSGTSGDITVSYAPPVAVDDTAYTTDKQPVTIDVLANDTDPSGLTLTVVSTTQGKKGSVSINQDGTLLYTPNAKPKGQKAQPNDQFTYTIDDGFGNTATATVSIRDTFVASVGAYDGLLVNGAPTNDNTGYLQVKTDATGKFKGTLYVGGVKLPVKGAFSDTGDYTGSVTRPLYSALVVQLHLDPAASSIAGSVADGGNTFTSSLLAKKQVKAGSLAGSYTVILPASGSFTGPNYPQGDGYATMKVSKKGKVTISGRLGDGTVFLSKTFLHADSTFDLYASIYSKAAPFAGSVSSALTFEDITGVNASDADGAVAWFKPASIVDPIYPSGFSMTTTALVSHYQKPKAGHSVFTLVSGPGNGQITLGDDSTVEAASVVTIKENNQVSVSMPNTTKIQLTIIPATGRISGSFIDPVSQSKQTFEGVVFQKQNVGAGVYTSAPQSYYFELIPN